VRTIVGVPDAAEAIEGARDDDGAIAAEVHSSDRVRVRRQRLIRRSTSESLAGGGPTTDQLNVLSTTAMQARSQNMFCSSSTVTTPSVIGPGATLNLNPKRGQALLDICLGGSGSPPAEIALTFKHVPSWMFHIFTVSSKLPLTCPLPQIHSHNCNPEDITMKS
jgi:hypothetical protein